MPSDPSQRQIFWLGAHEPVEAYLFSRLIQPGMNVVDAGANIGQYTLLAATAVGSSGSVHSFEPVPSNFCLLEGNLRLNRLNNVSLNRMAIWRKECEIQMELPDRLARNSGAYRVVAVPSEATHVPGLRLDTYIRERGVTRIDVIKMDIEGAEVAALEGATMVLQRDLPFIFMEVCPIHLARLGTDTAKLWSQLSTFGYKIWKIGDSAADSGYCPDLEGLGWLANVILHRGDLPSYVTKGWTFRSVLEWARSGEGTIEQ
jgi:FkbM family methyltransferase